MLNVFLPFATASSSSAMAEYNIFGYNFGLFDDDASNRKTARK